MNPFDSLFGGGMTLPSSGLLGPEDSKQLRNQALVKAGLAIAGGTGGLVPALSQGLEAGQETYQGGIKDALTSQQLQQNMYSTAMKTAQQAKVLEARRQYPPLPDANDHDALRKWMDQVIPMAINAGDMEVLSHVSEIRKSIEPKEPPANEKMTGISGGAPSLRAAFPNAKLDPSKTYTVTQDRSGKFVGQPMEEGINATNQARIDLHDTMTPLQLQRLKNTVVGSYESQLNQLHTTAAADAWAQVRNLAARSQAGTPTADDVMGLIDGILRLNNPGAVVRSSTMQIALDKIGTLPEKIQAKIRMASQHGWPPAMVASIVEAAKGIAEEHQKQAVDARERAMHRGLDAGVNVDEMDRALRDPWKIALPPNAPAASAAARLPGESPAAYLQRTGGQ